MVNGLLLLRRKKTSIIKISVVLLTATHAIFVNEEATSKDPEK